MVIDGWLRLCAGADYRNVDLAEGASDAFSCTGDTSDGLFGSQSSRSGSASDRLAASFTPGDASDPVRFPHSTHDVGSDDGDGTDDGCADAESCGILDDAARGAVAADEFRSDGAADGLLAAG